MLNKDLTFEALIEKVYQLESENKELISKLSYNTDEHDCCEKYKNLYDAIPLGYSLNQVIFDKENNPYDYLILEANKAYETHTGLTVSEIIGKSIKTVNPKVDMEIVKQFCNVAVTGIPFSYEYFSKSFNRYFNVQIFSHRKGYFSNIFTDVTIQKQADLLLKEKNEEYYQINEELKEANLTLHSKMAEIEKSKESLEKNEEKFRIVADFTYDWEYWLNEKDELLYISSSCERITGYKTEEFISDPGLFQKIIFPDDNELFVSHFKKYQLAENFNEVGEIDFRIVKRDGSIVCISHICRPVFDKYHSYIGRRISNRDITERKHAEDLLKQSESLFRLLAENSTDMIARHDAQGIFLYVSPSCKILLGYEPEDLIGHSAFEYVHPDDISKVEKSRSTIVEQPVLSGTIFRMRCKNGKYIWLETNSRSIINLETEAVVEIHAASRDISSRKQAEEALFVSRANLTAIIENTFDSIWAINTAYEIIYINGVFEQAFFLSFGIHLKPGMNLLNAVPEPIRPMWKERYDRALTKEHFIFEDKIDIGNIVLYIEVSMNPIIVDGKVIGASFFSRDISERKQSEEKIRESEEKFRALFESAKDGIFQISHQGDIVAINESFAQMHGYTLEELMKMNLKELDAPETAQLAPLRMKKLLAGESMTFEVEHFCKNGQKIPIEVSANLVNIGDKRYVLGFHRDITERKKTERMLRDIIDKNPMSIQILDKESYTLSVNPAHTKLFGAVPPPEYCLFTDPILLNQGLGELLMRAKNGEVVHFPDFYYNAHQVKEEFPDVPVWIRMLIFPLNDGSGKPERFVLMHEDITERKHAEESLHESEFRLARAEKVAKIGNWKLMLDSKQMIASIGASIIYGVDKDKMSLDFVQKIPLPEYRDMLNKALVDLITKEIPYNLEFKICRPNDGKIVDIHSLADHDKKNNIIFGVVYDVTERNIAEKKLRESEEKLSTLFGSMTEMVVLHDLVYDDDGEAINYRITDCNEAFTQITGIKKIDAVGKLATEVYQAETPPYIEEYSKVGKTGVPFEYTTFYAPMDKHFMISVVSPQKNRFATITTDITANQQIQEAITAKNKELENYLYVASHDLRSPLVNIQGFSQRLQKQADSINAFVAEIQLDKESQIKINKTTNEDIPKTLNFIFSNVTKMDTLINGLLQISRTGRIKMNIRKIDMNQLFKTILAVFNFQITEISAKVIIEELPNCYGDENQLNQLFSNIIGNAIKYRDDKKQFTLEIAAKLHYNKIIYSIKDSGIGIDPRHLEKIWDVFYRVDSTLPEAGEGIGLSLAKRIADKHKGKIWAESEFGRGSTFYIELQSNEFTE